MYFLKIIPPDHFSFCDPIEKITFPNIIFPEHPPDHIFRQAKKNPLPTKFF